MKNVLDISNNFADGGVYLKDISDNLPTLSHLADISNNFADGGVYLKIFLIIYQVYHI